MWCDTESRERKVWSIEEGSIWREYEDHDKYVLTLDARPKKRRHVIQTATTVRASFRLVWDKKIWRRLIWSAFQDYFKVIGTNTEERKNSGNTPAPSERTIFKLRKGNEKRSLHSCERHSFQFFDLRGKKKTRREKTRKSGVDTSSLPFSFSPSLPLHHSSLPALHHFTSSFVLSKQKLENCTSHSCEVLFATTSRKLMLMIRSRWRGCVFRLLCSSFLFRQFHKKVSFIVCSDYI